MRRDERREERTNLRIERVKLLGHALDGSLRSLELLLGGGRVALDGSDLRSQRVAAVLDHSQFRL
jgi:hypothetical protein